jgi:ubiquinone biosynthesis protein UbiJ
LKYDIDLIPTKEDINNYIDQVDEIKSRTERLMAKIK